MVTIILVVTVAIILFLTALSVVLLYNRDNSDILYRNEKQQENFGKYGEKIVANMLNRISISHKSYIFNDFTFKDNQGYSSNIDHIFICSAGIFVIETKSNKGIISGNEEDERWYAQKKPWQDDKILKNPIKQNSGHINHLRKMLKHNSIKIYSLIIFPFAELLNIENNNNVFNLSSAETYIISEINKGQYSDEYINRINIDLLKIKEKYEVSLEDHIKNIKK